MVLRLVLRLEYIGYSIVKEPIKDELTQLNSAADNAEAHEHLLMDFLSSISSRLSKFFGKGWSKDFLVEYTGFEPVASTMRMLRAPNCANTPCHDYITKLLIRKEKFQKKLIQRFAFRYPASFASFSVEKITKFFESAICS